MTDPTDKTDAKEGKRRLLKTLVAGGGVYSAVKLMPESWTKPVVESTLLPAHAQASIAGGGASPFGPFAAGGGLVLRGRDYTPGPSEAEFAQSPAEQDADNEMDDFFVSTRELVDEPLLDYFFPAAHASSCASNVTCMVDFYAQVDSSTFNLCVTGDINGCAVSPVDSPTSPTSATTPMFVKDTGGGPNDIIVIGCFHGPEKQETFQWTISW